MALKHLRETTQRPGPVRKTGRGMGLSQPPTMDWQKNTEEQEGPCQISKETETRLIKTQNQQEGDRNPC